VVDVAGDDKVPDRCDVVVIGGGIVGVSAAFFLARQGASVVLCEKGAIGAEQSGRNQGWVRISARPVPELPLALHSLSIWEQLQDLTSADVGYRRSGLVALGRSPKDLDDNAKWISAASSFKLDGRMIGQAELDRLLPARAPDLKYGFHSSLDGHAEPQLVAPAIAKAARRAGAVLNIGCAVESIRLNGGRIEAVGTEQGEIACKHVVIAAGAWSTLLCRKLGISLPQLKVRSSAMKIEPVADFPDINIGTPDYIIRSRIDGGFTASNRINHVVDILPDSFRFLTRFGELIRRRFSKLPMRINGRFFHEFRAGANGVSPYVAERILSPVPVPALSIAAKRDLDRDFPQFGAAKIASNWAGYVDVTPDELPVISGVDGYDGLVLATGFSGHGFAVGPAAGALVSDMVLGKEPTVDPTPFRLSRFR